MGPNLQLSDIILYIPIDFYVTLSTVFAALFFASNFSRTMETETFFYLC